MKKALLTIVAACALSLAVSAQNYKPYDNGGKPFQVYCELVSYYAGLFSSKINVDIDFGQQTDFWESDKGLVNEYGDAIKFNSMLDALNYMGERGWVLVEEYYNQPHDKDESPKHYYILTKTVTDRSQIMDGLLTPRLLKERGK